MKKSRQGNKEKVTITLSKDIFLNLFTKKAKLSEKLQKVLTWDEFMILLAKEE